VDIKLDLTLGEIQSNIPVDQPIFEYDAQPLVDEMAVRQSVKNIFNTMPGQKLLNPYLGLDLKRFLFDPISERVGGNIAEAILEGLVEQEPRITVENIKVTGVISEAAYYITFVIVFPNLQSSEVIIEGRLDNSGFDLTSNNKEYVRKKRQVRDRYWNFNE
jgi:phage baseplate assembly protein W